MLRYRAEILINRPAHEVFALATDLSRQHEWSQMEHGEVLGDGVMRRGAHVREVMRIGPWRSEMVSEVVEIRAGAQDRLPDRPLEPSRLARQSRR
jgi:hypothetical protein